MLRLTVLVLLIGLSFIGCQKSAGGGEETGRVLPDTEFNSDCGTVIGGQVVNPVQSRQGTAVIVTDIVGPSTVRVLRGNEEQTIQLRGLRTSIDSRLDTQAREVLRNMLGDAVLFTSGCSESTGGVSQVGQLYRPNGVSFSERLIRRGFAEVRASGRCGEAQVAGCYIALREQNRPEPTPAGNTISNFLWDPTGNDGNLVVYLNPANAQVVVNNDPFVNTGPSNGRQTTARTNKPGCAFGVGVQVQVFDSAGDLLQFPGGSTIFTITDGCERLEF